MRKLKVLHIILSLNIGGAERVVFDFITHDHSDRCHHQVCCLDSIGSFGAELQSSGVCVHLVQRRPGKDWRLIFKLAALIKRKKIDIVHTHGETPWFYGALATKLLAFSGTKCFTTIHGYGGGDRTSISDFRLWKFLAVLTEKIVVVADNLRTEMIATGFSGNKVKTILNGVDTTATAVDPSESRADWGLSNQQFVVGIIARLSPIKNHPLLLVAFSRLINTAPDARLIIVGDGPEMAALKKRTAELGLSDSIIFCGEQLNARQFYPLFDVFVLPSYSEGISMTLLEAMAAGVPVVASAVGGNVEIIESGENGLLFPSGNGDALYENFKKLYESTDLRRPLAASGRKRVEESFSLQAMIDRYLQLYSESTETASRKIS